ncbi:MAG: hydantoinase B/oxoprolinase family protein [Betaproteobacteria bacterium]|nr:hydantoinase B/oxoprolinase family protein [Betaproteobacteria bacterium]
MAYDPITLGILWNRLISITDEIVASLVRTSFSTVVRESYDLSCVLLDARGHSLAQGSWSGTAFVGTIPKTVRHLLKRFPPETLKPGDVLATNDPWLGTGHLFDITVTRPVFRKSRLLGFTTTVTHLPDIGGRGFSSNAREVYEEGLRLVPCKLYDRGKPVAAMFELIRSNVRVADQVIGDINANITANELGSARLLTFMDEYGIEDLSSLSDSILSHSEQAMRAEIAKIPPGTYTNTVMAEGVDGDITIACRIDVSGDRISIDYAGSSPQSSFAINTPFCYTYAFTAYALKCLTIPDIPNNEGAFRPVVASAPTGSILNPTFPAATGGRHALGHFVPTAIFGALQSVLPERVLADPGLINLIRFYGRNLQGERFSTVYFASGGMGAHAHGDGLTATPAPSNICSTPVEIFETLTGILVSRRAIRPDSGGRGRHRGGHGQEIQFVNATDHPVSLSLFANRTRFAARGFQGGCDGAPRLVLLNGQPVDPKSQQELAPGETVDFAEAGGGGFGPPEGRDPSVIARDERGAMVKAGTV